MRRFVMLVAAVAVTVVPTGPAGAAGSSAYCFHTWTDTASRRQRLPFVYGPGGGTSRTADFPGVFVFYPTAGDCLSKVTEFKVVRNATLFS
jgi:hypothetical protein